MRLYYFHGRGKQWTYYSIYSDLNPFSLTVYLIVAKMSLPKCSAPHWSGLTHPFKFFWHSATLPLSPEPWTLKCNHLTPLNSKGLNYKSLQTKVIPTLLPRSSMQFPYKLEMHDIWINCNKSVCSIDKSCCSGIKRPTRHIIGHFRDNLPRETLDSSNTGLKVSTKSNSNETVTQKQLYTKLNAHADETERI